MTGLQPGDPRRIGRYEVLGRLGEGAMGRVYLGTSPAGRAVAIKVVKPELADHRTFRARFHAEVEAARKVSGAVLAFAATGRPPFGTGHLHAIMHRTLHQPPDLDGAPEPLIALVTACLDTDPARRPPADRLPRLFMAAPADGVDWLPADLGNEVQAQEHSLTESLRAHSRARTRRRLLVGAAVIAGLTAAGSGTVAALADLAPSRRPGPPRLLWRHDTDAFGWKVFGSTAVLRGNGNTFTAYRVATGEKLWSAGFAHTVADATLIYAQASTGDPVIAFDPASRKVVWRHQLATKAETARILGPSEGKLIILDKAGTITAIDARTGRLSWTYTAPVPAPALTGPYAGRLLVGHQTGGNATLLGLDLATGAVRSTTPSVDPALGWPGWGDLAFDELAGDQVVAYSIGVLMPWPIWRCRWRAGCSALTRCRCLSRH